MNALTLAGSALALLTYFPLWKQIRSGSVKQNLLTWALWSTLDAVIAGTIIVQKGSFLLPVVYALGGSMTVFFIARSRSKARWTWFESMVSFLVLASMVIWYVSGSKVATVASTVAMLIAGIPQIADAWKKPKDMPLMAYSSYFVANCLSTAGGKNWSIEERFYPVSAGAFCLLIPVLAAWRVFVRPSTQRTQ